MRSMHHIEVDRGEGLASFHTAVDHLRAGEAVGIFTMLIWSCGGWQSG